MITKFGTLYAGHVDMGETGMAGTPVNDRSLSNERLISVFDKAAGGWLCGPADLVTEKLMRLQERCPGLEQVNAGSVIGTPQSVIIEQLQRFAEDVMPHFKTGTAAQAGAAGHAGAPA